MSNDRRSFLKQVGTGVAAAAAITKLAEQETAAASDNFKALAGPRRGDQIKLALELDGEFAGWLQSVEGGDAVGEVAAEFVRDKLSGDPVAKKHISNVKYEDISVTCGTGMSKAFYQWIKSSFDHKFEARSGSVIVADYDYNTASVLKFHDALITEIGFPALDAGAKDAAKMTLKFSPDYTERSRTKGRPILSDGINKKQKPWLTSNFRLRIDGLEDSCARVQVVEDLNVKYTFSEISDDGKTSKRYLSKIEFPDLKITLGDLDSDGFADWHERFVIKGDSESERNGSLEFLSVDMKESLFSVQFKNLGIFKFAPQKVSVDDPAARGGHHIKIEMYTESIEFSPPQG